MDKQEFKELLKELINEIDVEDEKEFVAPSEEPHISYDRREFIAYIMNYGKSKYQPVDMSITYSDELYKSISDYLIEELNLDYVIVREEDGCIAIATPQYIRNAKEEFAKILKIIPEVFTQVSSPMSTVLIIDCEKQYLRKAFLGIGADEWLL